MTKNSIFPQSFLTKQLNFSNEILARLFYVGQQAIEHFVTGNLSQLDPLVCENACHIRALVLWRLSNQYQKAEKWLIWTPILQAFKRIIERLQALPPIDIQHPISVRAYLELHQLWLELEPSLAFDVKFIFLSYLLTITKKAYPSLGFTLREKTSHEALSSTGLVHSKIKILVSSAQKELSAMSCEFIQRQNRNIIVPVPRALIRIYQDEHKRSFLPQYPTAKIILSSALEHNVPLILHVSRFLNGELVDTVDIGWFSNENKTDFASTHALPAEPGAALIFAGVVNYSKNFETKAEYQARLKQYSLLQMLLANFAAHPQFSGSLKNTPCVYKAALKSSAQLKQSIAQEWNHYYRHYYFSKTMGCSLENPSLLFLNHIYCDAVSKYELEPEESISNQRFQISEPRINYN